MPMPPARRPAAGRAAQADPAGDPPWIISARISRRPPDPIVYPPSSREIARRKAKAEAALKAAAAAKTLRGQVQPGLRPPPGRLFAADAAGLVLQGPLGGIGTSERIVRTLQPLTAGGRHLPAVLVSAGNWADEGALRDALAAIAPKLAAVGLKLCRRKAGLRMAKLKAA